MTPFIEKYQTIIIRIIVGLGVLLALFLLVATVVKIKEYHYVGSGTQATNTITVMGTGKVDRVPDTAKVNFSVSNTQKDVKTAQANVGKKVDSIVVELKAAGVEEKYIKTESYNSYPEYEYVEVACLALNCPKPGSRVLKGYLVTQDISVSIKKLDSVEVVLGILGRNNVTNISGPNFGFEDDEAVGREARDLAIADARAEAEKLAKSLGVRLVRIVSFSEQGGAYPMYAESRVMNQAKDASAPSIPVGERNIESNVTIVYEIQ